MKAPLAFVFVCVLFTAPWVVSDRCLASEGVFATRGGGSYSASSTDFVSPELFYDYFVRTPWVSATSTVTVARAGGDSLWVRVRGPSGYDSMWMHVEGSYSWQPTLHGDWTIDLGQPDEGYLIDFRSVTTVPRSALVAAVREDVLATSEYLSWPRRTERVLVAPLRRAERALDKGHEEVARRSLESFTALIPSFVEEGQIPRATGELWVNAAEYVLEGL
jgi:hypothetical protein